MFELNLALKYLLPKKSALSRTVISLVSVVIISLVVWLVLVFLSVTAGLEKNWLSKLTTLNAPLRLTPTEAYFSSYYYLSDTISSDSNYSYKTIKEKAIAVKTDPYNAEEDMEVPFSWPKPLLTKEGRPIDIVKETYEILDQEKRTTPSLQYEDFEMNGALMRLALSRPASSIFSDDDRLSYISQMSYLLTISQKNPAFHELLLPPSIQDLNNLLRKIDKASELSENSQLNYDLAFLEESENLKAFFQNIKLSKVITTSNFVFPLELFPKDQVFQAYGYLANHQLEKLLLPKEADQEDKNYLLPGKLLFENGGFVFIAQDGIKYSVSENIPILVDEKIVLKAEVENESLKQAAGLENVNLNIACKIQNHTIQGSVSFAGLELYDAKPLNNAEQRNLSQLFTSETSKKPFWFCVSEKQLFIPAKNFQAHPVLAPKNLKSAGVLLGDTGYLAFASQTPTSTQEHRLPIYVAGFYDPGLLPIGARCLLVSDEVMKAVSTSNLALEGISNNGLFVWVDDFKKAENIKMGLLKKLSEKGLGQYWQVQTYKDYEFSKDLMQQFQSDRLIFTLIAVIIIIVACSNIISLLMLLINDKKKEIAILQSMGASKTSIALIFGICGFTMGLLSSVIGSLAAVFTLKHLDVLVNFLSFIQGHNAFNAAFFGSKLPNALSFDALTFILITTPVISLTAALIPAIKACKLHPSSILRGE